MYTLPSLDDAAEAEVAVFVVEEKILVEEADFFEHFGGVERGAGAGSEDSSWQLVARKGFISSSRDGISGGEEEVAGVVEFVAVVVVHHGGGENADVGRMVRVCTVRRVIRVNAIDRCTEKVWMDGGVVVEGENVVGVLLKRLSYGDIVSLGKAFIFFILDEKNGNLEF